MRRASLSTQMGVNKTMKTKTATWRAGELVCSIEDDGDCGGVNLRMKTPEGRTARRGRERAKRERVSGRANASIFTYVNLFLHGEGGREGRRDANEWMSGRERERERGTERERDRERRAD